MFTPGICVKKLFEHSRYKKKIYENRPHEALSIISSMSHIKQFWKN